jgi:hypothetical protein
MESIPIDFYVTNVTVLEKRSLVLEEKEVVFSTAAIGSKKIVPKEVTDIY